MKYNIANELKEGKVELERDYQHKINSDLKPKKERSKTPERITYEAEVDIIRAQIGDLEEIRFRLGLSARKMAQLLMVDPSAWFRWSKRITPPPPHVYRALQWYLLLQEKNPGFTPQIFLAHHWHSRQIAQTLVPQSNSKEQPGAKEYAEVSKNENQNLELGNWSHNKEGNSKEKSIKEGKYLGNEEEFFFQPKDTPEYLNLLSEVEALKERLGEMEKKSAPSPRFSYFRHRWLQIGMIFLLGDIIGRLIAKF